MPTDQTYTVSVVCQGVNLTDEALERLFSVCGDVVPSERDGTLTITGQVNADDDLMATKSFIQSVRKALPKVRILHLDQDLVAISDIAARTNRSRESVRLLVDGKRGPGAFPPPVGTVGDGIRVWPWAVVIDWFRDQLSEDLGELTVSPETAAIVDAGLARAHSRSPLDLFVGAAAPQSPGTLETFIDTVSTRSTVVYDALVASIVDQARYKRASAVYLEPRLKGFLVRFGSGKHLTDELLLPQTLGERLASYFRELAGLDLGGSHAVHGSFNLLIRNFDVQIGVAETSSVRRNKLVLTIGPHARRRTPGVDAPANEEETSKAARPAQTRS